MAGIPVPPALLVLLGAVVVEALARAIYPRLSAIVAGRAPELAEDLEDPRVVCGDDL